MQLRVDPVRFSLIASEQVWSYWLLIAYFGLASLASTRACLRPKHLGTAVTPDRLEYWVRDMRCIEQPYLWGTVCCRGLPQPWAGLYQPFVRDTTT